MPLDTVQAPASDLKARQNAAQTVINVNVAHWLARTLHVVATLGVADVLGDQPETADSLAATVGADAPALGRMLRLLAAYGIFEARGTRFAHTDASRLLRDDHPGSLRPFVRLIGLPVMWESFGQLEHSARTGRPALEPVIPDGMFSHFENHPDDRAIFDEAMTAKAHMHVAAVTRAYDFSPFEVIADIGGGRGHLLRGVLDATPSAKGVLFDLPYVVANVAGNAPERMAMEGGDFFNDDLPPADAYLLMDVLHDWDDERAAAILSNVRKAARPGAKVLVVENIITDDPEPSWGKLLDINMLAITGGRERTPADYAEMLAATGWRLERIVDAGVVSIVEGT